MISFKNIKTLCVLLKVPFIHFYTEKFDTYVTQILNMIKQFIRSRLLALSTSSSMSTHTSVFRLPYFFHWHDWHVLLGASKTSKGASTRRWTSGVAEDFIWDIPGPWKKCWSNGWLWELSDPSNDVWVHYANPSVIDVGPPKKVNI